MATRGRIGIQLEGNSVLSVYHHFDSYPEWLGKNLVENFNTREKAAELIDGGDMSCCDDGTGKPQYYSERGEDCPPRFDDDIFEFLNKDNNEEFAYIFTVNNVWKCTKMNQYDSSKEPESVPIP
jgi:hypothetical protein